MKADSTSPDTWLRRFLSRASRSAGRALRAVTPTGWGVIAFTAAGYALGATLRWREAMIIAAGGLIVLIGSLGWLWGRLGLQMVRSLPRDRVSVGDRLVAEVEVTNPHRRPIGPRTVEDLVGDERVPLRVPALSGRRSHTVRYVVPTDHRGVFAIGPLRVVKTDPLGLFRREATHGRMERLFVTPRIHVIDTPSRSWTRDLDGQTFDASPEGGTAFHTLREYVRGDDVRHIHWRSTARTGTLMVRQYVDTRRPSTLLLLDNRADQYPDPDMFELAIEVAASVAVCATRSARPLAAHAIGADLGGAHAGALGEQMLERFCSVGLAQPQSPIDGLAEAARVEGSAATETIIVTGRASGDLLPLVEAARGSQPVVVRAALDPPPFDLPSCSIIDIGSAHEFIVRWNALVRR